MEGALLKSGTFHLKIFRLLQDELANAMLKIDRRGVGRGLHHVAAGNTRCSG